MKRLTEVPSLVQAGSSLTCPKLLCLDISLCIKILSQMFYFDDIIQMFPESPFQGRKDKTHGLRLQGGCWLRF